MIVADRRRRDTGAGRFAPFLAKGRRSHRLLLHSAEIAIISPPFRTLPSSSGQDAALSRQKQGFDSPWEYHSFLCFRWMRLRRPRRYSLFGCVQIAGLPISASEIVFML